MIQCLRHMTLLRCCRFLQEARPPALDRSLQPVNFEKSAVINNKIRISYATIRF